ncbi:hypothetical protein [Colwellia sp. PAMC 21821]|uniref:hypothetical protein n=1 Tax=Colwellia sp. PAMC 21821 TaxID=1816219 RepID=UPI0012DEDBEA|nr:hypothetical protein [Colwellia sp. PAMC 21821]
MKEKLGTLSPKEYKIDAEQLRKSFIYHCIFGGLAILILRISSANVFWAIITGSVIMCSYYYQFRKGGEPHSLIDTFSDSIYYLGFIMTLISLIVAMMNFDLKDGVLSASYMLTQFGAAMTTTLLGLVFRIIYKQFDTTIESSQLSARESLDETVRTFNIQMRSTNKTLARLAKTIDKNIEDTELRNEKSLELYESTQNKLIQLGEASIKDLSTRIDDRILDSLSAINNFTEKSSTSISELTKKSNDFLSSCIVNNIKEAESRTTKSIEAFELIQDNISMKGLKSAETLSENIEANLKKSLSNLNEHLKGSLTNFFDQVTQEYGESIKVISKSTGDLSNTFKGTNKEIKDLNHSLLEVTSSITTKMQEIENVSPDFKAIDASQKEFVRGLDKLTLSIKEKVENISTLDDGIKIHLVDLVKEYKDVLEEYKDIPEHTNLQAITEEENKLIQTLKERRKGLQKLSSQWNKDVEDMSKNAELFAENLVKTSKFITMELSTPDSRTIEPVT